MAGCSPAVGRLCAEAAFIFGKAVDPIRRSTRAKRRLAIYDHRITDCIEHIPGTAACNEVVQSMGSSSESARNLLIDEPFRQHPHRDVGKRRLPLRYPRQWSQIGVEKMPSRAQHTRYFRKETRKVGI